MNEIKQNVTGHKITTNTGIGTGIAVILIGGLKLLKIDLGAVLGVDSGTIVLGLSSVISSVLLLFAKDPKNKTENKSDIVKDFVNLDFNK